MRTTYTGPVKGRGVNKRGQANVSREELEDFKRKYGQHLTLRDLLNADRTGKTPPSEKAPLARGKQGANIEPSLVSASPARREAMDRASENARKREESKKAAIARQDAAASRGMDRLRKAGLTPGSTTLGQSLGAAAGMAAPPALRAASAVPKVAGMASKVSDAVKGAASKVSDAVKGMMGRRAAAKAAPERKEPVYDIPPMPPKHSSLRSRIAEREANKKDGGSTKAYAKGGMTKGGGCETRGKKARYI